MIKWPLRAILELELGTNKTKFFIKEQNGHIVCDFNSGVMIMDFVKLINEMKIELSKKEAPEGASVEDGKAAT